MRLLTLFCALRLSGVGLGLAQQPPKIVFFSPCAVRWA